MSNYIAQGSGLTRRLLDKPLMRLFLEHIYSQKLG